MKCPKCACFDDKVVDSRSSKEGAVIRRRRECLDCGHRFTTYEEIERDTLRSSVMVVVSSSAKRNLLPACIEPAKRDRSVNKLYTSSSTASTTASWMSMSAKCQAW